jgi:periplasmic protein TonB
MPEPNTLSSPRRPALISALIHATAIVAVLFVSTRKLPPIANLLPERETPIYLPQPIHLSRGGGGGGQRSPLPVPKGLPPKSSPRVFTMPVMTPRDTPPILEMPPEALGPATNAPLIDLVHMGSLTGVAGPMSGGPGDHGGLGSGHDMGAGGHAGPGAGDEPGVYGIGGLPHENSTKPALISKTEPEYSEEARRAKVQGTVVLSIVVGASGQAGSVRVIRSLGLGLDERAIEAVRKWKFRAATVAGKPVATQAIVEVSFRLL